MSKSPTFETELKEIEAIAHQLEQNQLPLEEALKAFEQGVTLSRRCQEKLAKAEQQVNILLDSQNPDSEQAFQLEDEE